MQFRNLQDVLKFFVDLINNYLVPLIISLALIYFLWGVAKYIQKPDEKGREMILWGLIGLFVMVSVWGLVNLLGGTFNLINTQPPMPRF